MATYYCPVCNESKSETPFCHKHGAMRCKEEEEVERLRGVVDELRELRWTEVVGPARWPTDNPPIEQKTKYDAETHRMKFGGVDLVDRLSNARGGKAVSDVNTFSERSGGIPGTTGRS